MSSEPVSACTAMGSVSQELRTPLTSILGFTRLLAGEHAGPLTAKQTALLERVERNGHRLLGLIEDLLTVAQIDAGSWERADERVELRDVIDTVVSDVEVQVADRDLKLMLRVDEHRPTVVRGDRVQLERVLRNLLSNAVKFTHDGGTVEVELTRLPDQLLLTVSDTGVGIPADELGSLFTRFFRASTATVAAVPGSGLGLSIAQSIVERHGGDIVVTSVLDQGTLVEISLPAAD